MSATFTPLEVALGLLSALVFAAICVRDIRAGVTAYLLFGWMPLDTIPLQGARITAGLRPAQIFATILVAVWLLMWRRSGRRLLADRILLPLALLLPVSLVSLTAGMVFADPAVDERHLKPLVSLGQIMLFAWPMCVYVVAADVVHDGRYARRMILLLAALAVFAPLVPAIPAPWKDFVGWTQPLALVASPFCLARALAPGAGWRRLWMAIVWLAPLVVGLWAGRAFYYGFWAVATSMVLLMRMRQQVIVVAPIGVAIVVLYLAVLPEGELPGPLQSLVQQETEQQSLGGRAGRLAIWRDAVGIWTDHPLVGVGPGNSWPYMNRYSVIDTPHNQYLNLLLELGLVGLGCYLAFLAAATRTAWRAWWRASGEDRLFLTGWLGAFAGMVIGTLVGDFTLPSIRNAGLELFSQFYPFWVLLGVMAGIARTLNRTYHAETSAPATAGDVRGAA